MHRVAGTFIAGKNFISLTSSPDRKSSGCSSSDGCTPVSLHAVTDIRQYNLARAGENVIKYIR